MQDTEHLDILLEAIIKLQYAHKLQWEVDRLKYFMAELKKLCPLQEGDRVRLTRTLTFEKPHGWSGYNPTFVEGAMATVRVVDHYEGIFRVDLVFDHQFWTDMHGQAHEKDPDSYGVFRFNVDDRLEKVPQ